MTVSNGEIWLVNLNPVKRNNEMGKIRPATVFQNDEIGRQGYPTTIIIPLTTSLVDDAEPIRIRIGRRGKLEKDSDLVLTQIRVIDNSRFIEKLGELSDEELSHLKKCFEEIVE